MAPPAKSKSGGGHGLRLTLPGAANAPHQIPGVPGEYRPDVPTPVGGKGQLSLEMARKLDKDPRINLELVKLDSKED